MRSSNGGSEGGSDPPLTGQQLTDRSDKPVRVLQASSRALACRLQALMGLCMAHSST